MDGVEARPGRFDAGSRSAGLGLVAPAGDGRAAKKRPRPPRSDRRRRMRLRALYAQRRPADVTIYKLHHRVHCHAVVAHRLQNGTSTLVDGASTSMRSTTVASAEVARGSRPSTSAETTDRNRSTYTPVRSVQRPSASIGHGPQRADGTGACFAQVRQAGTGDMVALGREISRRKPSTDISTSRSNQHTAVVSPPTSLDSALTRPAAEPPRSFRCVWTV